MDADIGRAYSETGAGKRAYRQMAEAYTEKAVIAAKKGRCVKIDKEFATPQYEALSLDERNRIWLDIMAEHQTITVGTLDGLTTLKNIDILVMCTDETDSRTPGELCARRLCSHGKDTLSKTTRLTMGSRAIDEPIRSMCRAKATAGDNIVWIINKKIIKIALMKMEGMAMAAAQVTPPPGNFESPPYDVEPPFTTGAVVPHGATFSAIADTAMMPRVVPAIMSLAGRGMLVMPPKSLTPSTDTGGNDSYTTSTRSSAS